MVLPMLGCSALMIVPSSIALFNHELRSRTYFMGNFLLNLWKVNMVFSVVYIAVVLYFFICGLKSALATNKCFKQRGQGRWTRNKLLAVRRALGDSHINRILGGLMVSYRQTENLATSAKVTYINMRSF